MLAPGALLRVSLILPMLICTPPPASQVDLTEAHNAGSNGHLKDSNDEGFASTHEAGEGLGLGLGFASTYTAGEGLGLGLGLGFASTHAAGEGLGFASTHAAGEFTLKHRGLGYIEMVRHHNRDLRCVFHPPLEVLCTGCCVLSAGCWVQNTSRI